jgi:hypothetical protein
MNPDPERKDKKMTDTMLMPGAEVAGVEISGGERNFLARHVNRVLHEERRLIADGHPHDAAPRDWHEIIDSFKRIAALVSIAADIGYEPPISAAESRFDLHSLPAAQMAVWVRRFLDADRSMYAFGAGRLIGEAEQVEAASPIALAIESEIDIGTGLLRKLVLGGLDGTEDLVVGGPRNEFGDC